MNMRQIPRLIPIWLWITVVIIIVVLSSSCKGGRSLGKGSVGTVVTPQTPQEINERNTVPMPPFEPLPPIPIIPPKNDPVITTNAVRSVPTAPESKPAKANPVIVNPKPAGESQSITPTINKNAPPVKLSPVKEEVKTPATIVEGGGVVITPPLKNSQTDNKATSPEIAGPCEVAPPAESFNWIELSLNYLLFILIAIFIWVVYDIFKTKKNTPQKIRHQNGVKKTRKKRSVKKKASPKKKLEEYKKTIPKGQFFKNDEKPKQ